MHVISFLDIEWAMMVPKPDKDSWVLIEASWECACVSFGRGVQLQARARSGPHLETISYTPSSLHSLFHRSVHEEHQGLPPTSTSRVTPTLVLCEEGNAVGTCQIKV